MNVSKNTKVVRVPIYECEVAFINTRKKYNYLIKHNDIANYTPDYNLVNGWCSWVDTESGPVFIVGLVKDDITVLVHEIVHLAHFIMDHKGIPISKKNSEVEAYLVGYILGELL